MKWFIPHAKDEDEVYESIKKHLARVLNIASFADRRIRKITYYHNRRTHEAEVGKRLPLIGEEVFAILYEPGRDLYHVCTPNRGVLRDMSVLVGASEVTCVEDFDTE